MNDKELLKWYIGKHYCLNEKGQLDYVYNESYNIHLRGFLETTEESKTRDKAVKAMKKYVIRRPL